MVNRHEIMMGIYEKAMPDHLSWKERLECVKASGFDFLEISIDESDFRLARLNNPKEVQNIKEAMETTNVPIYSMCLSGHRKYPLGSLSNKTRTQALDIMEAALKLAVAIGVQRIQLAGYDVYYEDSNIQTEKYFYENLKKCVHMASKYGVILGFETMETPFMNTVTKAMKYVGIIDSPYLKIYPDLGNLYNGNQDEDVLYKDILRGKGNYIAVHLKDTTPGVFRDLLFGEGRVDFASGIKAFYDQGVRVFNCEIWDDGKGNYLERMIETYQKVLENL